MTFGHEKLDVYQLSISYVAMLSRLGGRGYHVMESLNTYGEDDNDCIFDTDSDNDSDADFESDC